MVGPMPQDEITSAAGAMSLAALIARATSEGGGRSAAPVEAWNPPFCGDIDMEIRADGTWFYGGTPIGRPGLVRLFSSVLRKDDDGRTYLVTPVEKVGIRVEDAPFVAVEMSVSDAGADAGAGRGTGGAGAATMTFRTNVGDVVTAGPEHPLRFEAAEEGLKPYLHVRGRLEALVGRAVMHDLVAQGETVIVDGEAVFAVRSAGAVFPIMPQARLDALSQ